MDSWCFIAFSANFADVALWDDISEPWLPAAVTAKVFRLSPTASALSSPYPELYLWNTMRWFETDKNCCPRIILKNILKQEKTHSAADWED